MKYFTVLIFIILTQTVSFSQKERIALVIGNAKYQHGNSLKNPVNDANLMARTLKSLNFKVIKKINATRKQMNEVIIEFSKQVKDCETALFYYAGHGIQVDGVNYIIPTDAKIDDPVAVQFEALNVDNVVMQFEYYANHANIVILDACRENPFLSWVRGNMNSLAPVKAPRGTIIAFATGSGSVAYDGTGSTNGLYTGVLAKEMFKAQRIEDVFINTRNKVYDLSKGKQQPQEWSQLSGTFYFTDTSIESKDILDNVQSNNTEEDVRLNIKNDVNLKAKFKDRRDGKLYKTIKIGKQTWMAENLAYDVGSGCWKYKNDENNIARLGYLYNWETAKFACPTGWRLPNKDEFSLLLEHVADSSDVYDKLIIGGESGFNAQFGGLRDNIINYYDEGFYEYKGQSGYYWTNTKFHFSFAYGLHVLADKRTTNIFHYAKKTGLSVKCIKE